MTLGQRDDFHAGGQDVDLRFFGHGDYVNTIAVPGGYADPQNADLHDLIEETRALFAATPTIRCPFFGDDVTLNADGFNHLLNKPNRQPRNVSEQMLKLRLVKKTLRSRSGSKAPVKESPDDEHRGSRGPVVIRSPDY